MTSTEPNPFPSPESLEPRRNNAWILPVGCAGCGCLLVPLVLLGIGATGLISLTGSLIKSTGAYQTYQLAAEQVEASPQVAAALGTPVSAGWTSKVTSHEDGTSGKACLRFSVSGANRSGSAYAEGERRGGSWHLHQLVVQPNGGDRPLTLVELPPNNPQPLCPDFDTEELDPVEPDPAPSA